MGSRKIIFSSEDFSVLANGALSAYLPGFHHRLPLMPVLTKPPNMFVAVDRDLLRCQSGVFCGMPLGGKFWVFGCQRVWAIPNARPRAITIRASGIRTGTIKNHGLPFVPVLTKPPGLFLAAIGYRFRGQGFISRGVPLTKELFPFVFDAIVI